MKDARMKIALYLILTWLIATLPIRGGDKAEIKWITLDAGMAEAKKSDKKLLIDVYTDWCGWCKRMDKDVFGNDRVSKYLTQQYVLVKLNAESKEKVNFRGKTTSAMELAQAFGVTGYPSIIFLDSNGEIITSLPGYVSADRFIDIVKFIGEDYYQNMKWEEFQQKRESKEIKD